MPYPFASIEFTDYTGFPMESTGRPGISHYVLARAEDGVGLVHVAQFEPGTDTSSEGPQLHDFWEYVLILEGSMIDLTLHQEFKKGMVAIRNPGMPHGPWKVPAGGCRLFEIRSRNPL